MGARLQKNPGGSLIGHFPLKTAPNDEALTGEKFVHASQNNQVGAASTILQTDFSVCPLYTASFKSLIQNRLQIKKMAGTAPENALNYPDFAVNVICDAVNNYSGSPEKQ